MKIAVLGMGIVGSGVLKVIEQHQELLKERCGENLEVTHIFSRTLHNHHNSDLSGIEHVQSIEDLKEIDVDLVVETMGGVDLSYDLQKHFLGRGIHVVSANKDMLALHIDELSALGNANEAQLAYEATSAGGVPIVHAIEHSLQANKIYALKGILNGTSNYMLTKMSQEGAAYEDALAEAQEKGFAEADPTDDVGGLDARRKIVLLSRLAYGKQIDVEKVPVRGIDEVEIQDIEIAQAAGYEMKLLGSSLDTGAGVDISVQPMFLPKNHQLAQVNQAMNAVYVQGDIVGETMFYGPGAGSLETASAIVSDVMNIARLGFIGNLECVEEAVITSEDVKEHYYIRFNEAILEASLENIAYEVIDAEKLAIITEAISADQLASVKEAAEVAAAYQLIKE